MILHHTHIDCIQPIKNIPEYYFAPADYVLVLLVNKFATVDYVLFLGCLAQNCQ